jgi:Tfp pilus assembly protein PilV
MDPLRRPAADESGISVVEVLIAAVILALTALAIATLSTGATHGTYRAEQDQVVVNRLQNELERMRQLPFNQVALTSTPQTSTQANDPGQRVSSGGTQFDLNRNGTNTKPLAFAGGTTPEGNPIGCGAAGQPACGVNPGPEPFQSGDVSGNIYRYVVYPGVPGGSTGCPGCSPDYFKRIIVVITLDTTVAGGTHPYQEIQSNVSSPDAVPSNNPVPPCDQNTECPDQQSAVFLLTDTPCVNPTRVAPSSHDTHNTRGRCTDGGQTGLTPGAPDLMLNAPPDTAVGQPPNYSEDVTRSEDPKIGLALLRTTSVPGCAAQVLTGNAPNQTLDLNESEDTPQLKIHTWVTNDLNSDFGALTTADATLELWTKSLGGAAYPATLCVYVFKRIRINENLNGTNTEFVVDTPATINLNAPYLAISKATWPQQWAKVTTDRFDVNMLSVDDVLNQLQSQVPAAQFTQVGQARLGLALTVAQGSGGDALDVMYDEGTYDSRFELDTPKNTCVIPCP